MTGNSQSEINNASPGCNYGIVALSHLRWSFVWQRPQQFLSRFAKTSPVLFVEEPEFNLEPGQKPQLELESVMENVTVAHIRLAQGTPRDEQFEATMRDLTEQAISEINTDGKFDQPLLWFYNPMDAPWALGQFNSRGVVYDCMDELSQFRFAPANLVQSEKLLLENADIVFTGGYELWTRKKAQHSNVHFFGCGVEYNHFALAQADETMIPEDVAHLASPILGWFGVIDERMDYDLVAALAAARPDWNFVMVGPVVKVDPNSLPQAPNIHWVGQRDYMVLPNYCKAFDVCMMSFAINEATEFINPTKALEYLSTGKPVISTPVKDVVRQYKDLVYIAATPDEFIQHAEAALGGEDAERVEQGVEKARNSSWESTVEQMQNLIAQAISTGGSQCEATSSA